MIIAQQGEKKIYSDGAETEQKMLQIARQFPEDKSEDFIADDSTYTINNTFSSVRRNILNWYPFKEHASILEVGAGMGAITGLLCDVADSVISIEMSEIRADVIRTRYAQRENLTVISENINTWNTDQRFDYIVFIGVLEYAAVFSDARRPYDEFLTSVKHLLNPDGIVLFAIENRFGLKYWLGASEDHLQTPFVGVSGYPDKKSPRTFSQKELEDILDRVGLEDHRFYAVLPDYKFPELIFSEECRPDYMNLKKVSFTYSKNSILYADEKELYRDIVGNGVFSFFANSFLVEASSIGALPKQHVTHVSSKGEVYKEYRVSTVIDNMGNVYKQPMHQDAVLHIQRIQENTEYLQKCGIPILPVIREGNSLKTTYHKSQSAQQVFRQALEDNDIATVHKLLDSLQKNLLKSSGIVDYNINNFLVEHNLAQPGLDYGRILQKAFVDMTFYNAFWEEEDLLFYDQEWCFERLPLRFCLYYATKSAYTRADVDTAITLDDLMSYLKVSPAEYESYDRVEEVIWSKVLYRQTDFYGADGYCNRYGNQLLLETKIKENTELKQQNESNLKQIDNLLAEYESIKEKQIQSEKAIMQLQDQMAGDAIALDNFEQELEKRNLQLSVEKQLNESLNTQLQASEERHQQNIQTIILEHREEQERARQEYQCETQDLRQTILNKEGHIQLLLEVEREYEREKHSRTYRMALVFRRISTFFLPPNSRRRFLVKMLAKGIRHPKLMLRMVNPRRIRNFFTIVKKEGMDGVNEHYRLVEEYETSRLHACRTVPPEITQVEDATGRSIADYVPLSFIKYKNPEVSIVIPVYNQFEYTYNCLESILKNSDDIRYEVIVADDCSTDITRELEQAAKGIRIIRNKDNLRFLKNCNHAARQAKGKYILFLNNDTQVQPGWLTPLVKLIEKDEKIGMVGSKLIYPDGRLQEAGGIIWGDGHAWNYGHGQNPSQPEFNYVKEVDYISGAAIMIRADLWKEIGGFDEHFAPSYCEDSDLAFEVRRRGYKLVYQPQSVVVHFEGMSNGTDVHSGLKQYQVVNSEKLARKWAGEFKKQSQQETDLFHARDRSQGKKTILVIDHYVPMFDKDAGSRTIWQYINMFVEKGYNVKFMGDNFYPHEPYTTALQQIGVEVLYGPWYAENYRQWILDNKNNIDFAFLNRPHITEKYIDLLKEETDIKCIYYGCDLHCMRIRREYELCHDKKLLAEAEDWERREFSIMRKTDINYYPSSVEIEQIHKVDASIPAKTFDIYVYEKFRENIPMDFSKREGIMFVGGFGHPPNEDAVLWFVDKVFPLIRRRCDIPFYVIGANPTEQVKKLAGDRVVIKGFVTDDELEEMYDTCRMAVIPLRYGAGVKGKVIEALYYGIPMVTTSIGIEGITGAEQLVEIADTADSFADKVVALYNDMPRLNDTVQMYQDYVKEHCSVEAVWNHIKDDFAK